MREGKGYRLLIKLGVEKVSPKEYLAQIFEIEEEVQSKLRERDAIMNTIVKATDSTQEPIYSNQFSSSVENTVMKLFKYNDETNEYIDKLADFRIQIAEEIAQMETKEYRSILRERYICSKKWEEIAVETNYDLRWVYRLHGRALEEFAETFPDKFT